MLLDYVLPVLCVLWCQSVSQPVEIKLNALQETVHSGSESNSNNAMWACDPAVTTPILNSYHVAGPLFSQALQSFFAAQCALAGDHLWPADAIDAVIQDPNYDFIVVGAGSAGSVVANRLSEVSNWKVLLVEAGGNPTLATELPQLFYSNMNTDEDWAYKTQPQDGACRGYKTKGCAWPRGKLLGGSSSINAMFYVRGNKLDYDEWAASGCEGWSFEEILPYFKKSENLIHYTKKDEKYHGKNGYLNVENEPNPRDLENIIIKASVELGLKNSTDINGEDQMGIIKSYTTTLKGVRCSTARAFLGPIKDRKNLHVIKNAVAKKLLFKPGTNTVNGVILEKDGRDIIANARKEVIISSGSINSPQLLILSGIGPQKHLKDLDIEVKADLPVGENLQDHLFVPFFYTMPTDEKLTTLPNLAGIFAQYMFKNEGPLADTSPHRVISFWNTTDPMASSPDIQTHYLVFPAAIDNMLNMFEKHDLSDEIQHKFEEINRDKSTIIVITVLLKPKSKGKLILRSKIPTDKPLIYANYFDDPDDMKTLINAIKQHCLKLGNTTTFKEAGFKLEWLDIDACKNYDKHTDDYLDCISREMTFSLYHPVGTVKMGAVDDKTAVVDPELRVKNIHGLRVIDASVMPSIVRGNTNAPSIMIGEKGADMVKQYWLAHTEL